MPSTALDADLSTHADHVEVRLRAMTWGDMIVAWQQDEALVDAFCDTLAAAPYPAFCWETPPVCRSSLRQPFAFVLVPSPSLAASRADPAAFRSAFARALDFATFDNLGGDAVLVAPVPQPGENAAHIGAFLRSATRARLRGLWEAVGAAIEVRLGDAPLWVSTAGLGVPWLHVRLDAGPKYYRHGPYRRADLRSAARPARHQE